MPTQGCTHTLTPTYVRIHTEAFARLVRVNGGGMCVCARACAERPRQPAARHNYSHSFTSHQAPLELATVMLLLLWRWWRGGGGVAAAV